MSKKNQSFTVTLENDQDAVMVLVNEKPIGQIQQQANAYSGLLGQDVVISMARSEEEALQAILAAYNLYH
ncbi:DUF2969 family protein [Leuconostocaceae bacterium ESL0958]|nr:DUF2969 family protein [Leuconostocaceae bacterium ESL0958]